MTHKLYDEIVEITEEYLGPAAPRFVTRQISYHLDKAPSELTAGDIPTFTEWATVTLAMLTADKRMVSDYAEKLSRLADD